MEKKEQRLSSLSDKTALWQRDLMPDAPELFLFRRSGTIFKTADVLYQPLKSHKQTVQEQTGLILTALSV